MTAYTNPRAASLLYARLRRSVRPTCRTASTTTSNRLSISSITDSSPNGSSLSITIGDHRRPRKHSPHPETAFNIHSALQYHRDHGACGFLLVS